MFFFSLDHDEEVWHSTMARRTLSDSDIARKVDLSGCMGSSILNVNEIADKLPSLTSNKKKSGTPNGIISRPQTAKSNIEDSLPGRVNASGRRSAKSNKSAVIGGSARRRRPENKVGTKT